MHDCSVQKWLIMPKITFPCLTTDQLVSASNSPVHADGDEIEDGGGGADDVHGDVDVAQEERQGPLVVHLRKRGFQCMTLKQFGIHVINILWCQERSPLDAANGIDSHICPCPIPCKTEVNI